MPRLTLFLLATGLCLGVCESAFNATLWSSLHYVQKLLGDSMCVRVPHACSPKAAISASDQQTITGLVPGGNNEGGRCEYCSHGANMVPWLIQRYSVRSLVEIGVCTGMSVVNVVASVTSAPPMISLSGGKQRRRRDASGDLERYYLVDPWGGMKCKPGCACARHINQMSRAWPDVIRPLRGYSVEMASRIPNASLDLAFVDAAHDYRNARADILAYWPKIKPNGVLAGHDFAHWRNWAEVRQDKLAARGPYSTRPMAKGKAGLPPAYGVAQATQEIFFGCHVHVRWNTWWVERATCEPHQLLQPSQLV